MKDKFYKPEMIYSTLDTARDLIPVYAGAPLAQSLALLPEDVIDFVIYNLVFITEEEGGGAYYSFNHVFFRDKKGFILIPDSTWKRGWNKDKIQIAFVIAHEVAHAFLNHEINTFDDTDIEKRDKEEIEADKLAVKWLSRHYEREDLMKLCDSAYRKK